MKKFFLVLFLLIPFVCAQDYYADVTFAIDESGLATIKGITNYPEYQNTQVATYTSKQKNLWTLNISTDEVFTNYIYEVQLPEGALINYVKGENVRIGVTNNKPFVRGTAEQSQLQVFIQYSIEMEKFHFPYWIPVVLFILLIFFYGFKTKHHKPWYLTLEYSDRQQEIVTLIHKHKGSLAQSQLENIMDIPKSSLSRNIDSLTKRGVLTKTAVGMSNRLTLNKEPPK